MAIQKKRVPKNPKVEFQPPTVEVKNNIQEFRVLRGSNTRGTLLIRGAKIGWRPPNHPQGGRGEKWKDWDQFADWVRS